jgi:hypothetical protein
MSSRPRAARALAERLTEAAGTPVTARWDNPSRRPGHGAWRLEWAEGPAEAGMRRLAAARADAPAPLDVDLAALRWSRRDAPATRAAGPLTRAGQAAPPATSAVALAPAGDDLRGADTASRDAAARRAPADLAPHSGDHPRQRAAALTAAGATKPGDETPAAAGPPARCACCGGALGPPAPTGRPARWCSPACRTRAWRGRQPADTASPPGSRAAKPKPNSDEYRFITPGAAQPCPAHPGCVIARCGRLLCGQPVHILNRPGRPRRYCSPACRVAEHRLLR